MKCWSGVCAYVQFCKILFNCIPKYCPTLYFYLHRVRVPFFISYNMVSIVNKSWGEKDSSKPDPSKLGWTGSRKIEILISVRSHKYFFFPSFSSHALVLKFVLKANVLLIEIMGISWKEIMDVGVIGLVINNRCRPPSFELLGILEKNLLWFCERSPSFSLSYLFSFLLSFLQFVHDTNLVHANRYVVDWMVASQKICPHPNPWNLWMLSYLEKGSLWK